MSDKIPVTVIITTYDPGDNSRFTLLYRTLQALKDKLVYPNLRWIVTDDGSTNHDTLVETLKHSFKDIEILNTEHKGVGFAKNNALRHAFEVSPYVFLLEDDWELKDSLDLLSHVQNMLDHPDIGMVRFGYLGGELNADYTRYGDTSYWYLKPASGFYVYSGQVSLRNYAFYSAVGFHSEGTQAGQEEEDMCWRYNALENPPKILWPAIYGCTLYSGPFTNIGLHKSVNAVNPQL